MAFEFPIEWTDLTESAQASILEALQEHGLTKDDLLDGHGNLVTIILEKDDDFLREIVEASSQVA